MKNKELLREYCDLGLKFKELEIASEVLSKTEEGEYLFIRLDGIGLSKKYLKDKIKK